MTDPATGKVWKAVPDDFEACIAHLECPAAHRRVIRTTNLLERLFVEERRHLEDLRQRLALQHAKEMAPVVKGPKPPSRVYSRIGT